MNKTEELLLEKIKGSILGYNREAMTNFALSMLDFVWNIPSERERLIGSLEITGISSEQAVPLKKERKPRKKKEKAVQKKKTLIKPKQMSDEELAKAIINELEEPKEKELEKAKTEPEQKQPEEKKEPPKNPENQEINSMMGA